MAFHSKPFEERIGQMGDRAEFVFESTYPEGFVRFGLNRPPLRMASLPAFLRYTPDYLTSKGLVEVQGFGRDRTAKFKLGKMEALAAWQHIFRVDFFLWDSQEKRYGWLRMPELQEAIGRGAGHLRSFANDGNQYWAFDADRVPVIEWIPFGDVLGARQ